MVGCAMTADSRTVRGQGCSTAVLQRTVITHDYRSRVCKGILACRDELGNLEVAFVTSAGLQ